jgi:hypothetical protein
MHQGLSVGLHGQTTQGVVGLLEGMALRAESGVTQARATRLKGVAAPCCIGATAGSSSIWATAAGGAIVATRTGFVTKTSSGCGLGFLLARSVIAAHSDHLFRRRRGFRNWRRFSCNFDRGFCSDINRCF